MCIHCKLDGIEYSCKECGTVLEHEQYNGVTYCPKCEINVESEDKYK